MNQTLFFYDLETSGLRSRDDRLMQFAGQRTNLDLEPVGEPVNIFVKISDDVLPSPAAIGVTGITPQKTLEEGILEPEFCKKAVEEIFTPGTVALGYNTVRFDDEFMRATFWRNFYDPYEWEWKDGRSRWDMLDVVRMTRALRPEGINWPFTDAGKPTNSLEYLTSANGLSHEHAHDALSDVYATIEVARLIKSKQPDLFKFLFDNRGKKEAMHLANLERPTPVVYVSGRYSNEFNKATVVVPIAPSRNGNVLVYDLRYNLEELLAQDEAEEKTFYPIVKELCYNKCPALAPLSVLTKKDGWKKLGLTPESVQENLEILYKHPDFIERMRTKNEERPEFPPAEDPEQAIYDGFLNERDKVKVEAVRNANVNKLADFHPEFDDARLPELLLHYKGRNYPSTLSEHEMEQWEKYRHLKIQKQMAGYLEELEKVKDDFIKEELRLYLESLF